MILSVCCRISLALVIETPGKVVGMYRRSPSQSGGMNSEPICWSGMKVAARTISMTTMTPQRHRKAQFRTGV
jgi:hypothetical protein